MCKALSMNSIVKIVLLLALHSTGVRCFLLVPEYKWPSIKSTPPVNQTAANVRPQQVLFYLFTIENPNTPQQLLFNNKTILQHSPFNVSQPLKVVTHGWRNNHSSPACVLVRQGFLRQGNYNVIVVDWGQIAMHNYLYAASRVRAVGALVGAMIDFLVALGSDPANISVVGHSLGAHVAGLAALQSNANISHVVGLDPAGPGFLIMGSEGRISKKDANYVEIVHTCGGELGLFEPLGDADFYPNGGAKQAGCGVDPTGTCSHSRAYMYYAESLSNPVDWYAIKCNTSEAFKAGKCSSNIIVDFPRWKAEFNKPPGIYQLRTASTAPYGLGLNGTQPVFSAMKLH